VTLPRWGGSRRRARGRYYQPHLYHTATTLRTTASSRSSAFLPASFLKAGLLGYLFFGIMSSIAGDWRPAGRRPTHPAHISTADVTFVAVGDCLHFHRDVQYFRITAYALQHTSASRWQL